MFGDKTEEVTAANSGLRYGLSLLLGLAWFLSGCQQDKGSSQIVESKPAAISVKSEEAGPIKVVATNAFLLDVARGVGGDSVQVEFLVPPGTDPTLWKPTADDLVQMQEARLLILNGASFEPWVASVALPSSRMVRTANGFRDRWIETEEILHSHGPGGEHSHPGTACTTWLDFTLAQEQVIAVRERLKQLLPGEGEAIDRRAEAFLADLKRLDQEMERLAGQLGSRPLIASHPVFQYWARRYGLNLRAVNWEPTNSPGEREWEEFEQITSDFPATVFIWEASPVAESQAALLEKGVTSLTFSPAANLPANGLSWRDEMNRNLERLKELLK